MALGPEVIKNCFTLPNANISHLTAGTNTFDFVNRHSTHLIVTIGDSWTWGDDLSSNNEQTFRLQHVFGNLIAQKLCADFLNLSVPGAGNYYIKTLFEEFAEISANLHYDKITIVVTFTEHGRDFNGWFDRDIDYASWLASNIRSANDYNEFLKWQMTSITQCIADRANTINNLKLIVASNFVDCIGFEPLRKYQTDRTWLEVYAETFDQYVNVLPTCYCVSSFVFENLQTVLDIHWQLDKQTLLSWCADSIDRAQQRLSILNNKKYFNKLGHPTVAGHRAWADYLLTKIS